MCFDAIIAIPTFRRPAGLQQLLTSLRPSLDRYRVAVVVGDNACDAETCAIVTGFARRYPDIHYLPVPARGISQNRNALLAAYRMMTPAPWLAMLDDDLIAPPDWLEHMLNVGRACDADVVGGPYRIDETAPGVSRLVRNSILVNRPNHPTGPIDRFHAGGNMLLSRRLVMAEPLLWFDTRLGTSGGEDMAFLETAKSRGGRFAWSAQALCIEDFPPGRGTAKYLFGRYYSTGNAMAHIALPRMGRMGVLALVTRRLVASLLRVGDRLARCDRDGAVQRLFDAAWAAGALGVALGLRRSERYR